MKEATFFVSLFFTLALYSQKEASNWVFGNNAGVSWNTGVPVAFSGAVISQTEGVACMSDAAGQLLFYSDGMSVWNRTFQVMPNGGGLMGGGSSTQSAITVPWPGNSNNYFLFTAPDNGSSGLRYSVIDMSLQGGLGDVVAVSKNTLLYTPSCEKVTAVKHANGTDVWVISHELNTNSFYTYLVTSAGVNNTPVISNIGSVLSGTDAIGHLRISPDGTKLANPGFQTNFFEVFDFNTSTGVVSNNFFSDVSFTSGYYPYGAEFSPSGRYLYLSGDGSATPIYQYDLQASNILSSKTTIGSMQSSGGALQLGPDDKIYVADYTSSFLNVINNPDQAGLLCNFQANAVPLAGGTVNIGLPNFISSYFAGQCSVPNVSINAVPSSICAYDSSQICAPTSFTVYNWSNGGTTNCITANQAGNYKVTVTDNSGCTAESNFVVLSVYPASAATITNPTPVICASDSAQICVSAGFTTYLWNVGATDSCITTRLAGNYYLTVTDNNGCTVESNRVSLSVYPIPPVSLSVNGDTLSVYNAVTQQWYRNGIPINNATLSTYISTQGGSYTVMITDSNGCAATSSPVIISGIGDVIEEDGVLVYPNPSADGGWQLTTDDNLTGGVAEMFDANGRMVFHSPIVTRQSTLTPDVARGVYLLRISSNRNTIVRKLIKL